MPKFDLQNPKAKKKLLIIGTILLLIIVLVTVFGGQEQKPAEPVAAPTKKKISSPVNVIAVAERPYLRLEPSSDGHHIIITVLEVKKAASQLDYEMEYQTGSMLQGFGDSIKLDNLPVSNEKLFGSQSAGGAITYHEDIKGGNLLAEFSGAENYAVKSAWRYFENSAKASEFISQDTKFTISNQALSKHAYLIIYNSPGYPGEITGELLAGPYVVSSEKSLKTISSDFTVSFRASEAGQIMGYDGSKWQEMDSQYTDGVVTASGPAMDVYVLVKK
jgi:hypothetical protein